MIYIKANSKFVYSIVIPLKLMTWLKTVLRTVIYYCISCICRSHLKDMSSKCPTKMRTRLWNSLIIHSSKTSPSSRPWGSRTLVIYRGTWRSIMWLEVMWSRSQMTHVTCRLWPCALSAPLRPLMIPGPSQVIHLLGLVQL